MTGISDVRYERSGDVSIAYQVVGEGPLDLVFVRGITGDLLSTWEQPLLSDTSSAWPRTDGSCSWTSEARGSPTGSPASRRPRPGWTTSAP
jgi:hypothetical protein